MSYFDVFSCYQFMFLFSIAVPAYFAMYENMYRIYFVFFTSKPIVRTYFPFR